VGIFGVRERHPIGRRHEFTHIFLTGPFRRSFA
jgi:hypothetical protein